MMGLNFHPTDEQKKSLKKSLLALPKAPEVVFFFKKDNLDSLLDGLDNIDIQYLISVAFFYIYYSMYGDRCLRTILETPLPFGSTKAIAPLGLYMLTPF